MSATAAALLDRLERPDQITLGDSDIVVFDFDERDPSMLDILKLAVAGAKRNRRHIGICGEVPANYPEIARFLTRLWIDSMSVNSASILRTIGVVYEAERSTGSVDPRYAAPAAK